MTPTYAEGDWFVQAQAEIVANKDQSQTQPTPGIVDADDAWVRIGQWRKWDLMFGRFEAFEIYHRGMGLDINTEERLGAFDGNNQPPDIYGATFLFDRPARPGNVAFHLYPYRYLRIELLAQYGGLGQYNEIGGRPAVIFDIGWLKLKAAAEYQWLTARNAGDKDEKQNRGVRRQRAVRARSLHRGRHQLRLRRQPLFTHGNLDTPATRTAALSSIGAFVKRRVVTRPAGRAPASTTSPRRTSTSTSTPRGYSDFVDQHAGLRRGAVPGAKQLFVKLVGAYANSRFEESFSARAPTTTRCQRPPPRAVSVLKLPAICSKAFRNGAAPPTRKLALRYAGFGVILKLSPRG